LFNEEAVNKMRVKVLRIEGKLQEGFRGEKNLPPMTKEERVQLLCGYMIK